MAVATSSGTIEAISLLPEGLVACPEAVDAVRRADMVVLGPGSWFTSVLPHLMVPALAEALVETDAHLVVVLNLAQEGETGGFAAADHLRVLLDHAPGLPVGTVVVDATQAAGLGDLEAVAACCGAGVLVADISRGDGSPRHHPEKLAAAYAEILASL